MSMGHKWKAWGRDKAHSARRLAFQLRAPQRWGKASSAVERQSAKTLRQEHAEAQALRLALLTFYFSRWAVLGLVVC